MSPATTARTGRTAQARAAGRVVALALATVSCLGISASAQESTPKPGAAPAARTTTPAKAAKAPDATPAAIPAPAAAPAPIADAAEQQDLAAVRGLVARGEKIQAAQADGTTALHWGVHWNNAELVTLLLSRGADVNAKTDLGVTPLVLACQNGNATAVKALLQAGASPGTSLPSGETPLMTCARTGATAAVQDLLAHHADPNVRIKDERGQTALMWAAAEGHTEVVKTLLAAHADANAKTGTGLTPLFFAARHGHVATAQALLDAGANINAVAPDGSTPLLIAAASVDAVTASDYRFVPAASGHEALAIAFVRRGANVGAADQFGMTALHYAVETEKHQLLATLIEAKAPLNARLTKGLPFRRGDYVSRAHFAGATPFWLAAKDGKVADMEALARAGADTTLPSANGTTPLMIAAGVGQTDSRMPPEDRMVAAVTFALEHGGKVSDRNSGGQTALHGAASISFDKVIRLLVSRGAEVNAPDKFGRTPFDLTTNPMRPRPKTGDLLKELAGHQ